MRVACVCGVMRFRTIFKSLLPVTAVCVPVSYHNTSASGRLRNAVQAAYISITDNRYDRVVETERPGTSRLRVLKINRIIEITRRAQAAGQVRGENSKWPPSNRRYIVEALGVLQGRAVRQIEKDFEWGVIPVIVESLDAYKQTSIEIRFLHVT